MLRTGFPALDAALGGGFLEAHVGQLVGAPGSGKTAVLFQMALAFAEQGQGTILLPFQSSERVRERLLNQGGASIPDELHWPMGAGRRLIDELEQMLELAPLDKPKALLIDRFDQLDLDAQAPSKAALDPIERERYLMERLWHLAANRRLLVLVARDASEVEPGHPFALTGLSGRARGGGQLTDYCDAVLHVWQPQAAAGLSKREREARANELNLELVWNRTGPQALAELMLDELGLVGPRDADPWRRLSPEEMAKPRTRPSALAERWASAS